MASTEWSESTVLVIWGRKEREERGSRGGGELYRDER
jgi:hypothetical protein